MRTRQALTVAAAFALANTLPTSSASASCHIVAFVQTSVSSPESGSVALQVELRGRQSSCGGTVDWGTIAGSASAGSDYTSSSGTLTFTAGSDQDRVQQVAVPIVADTTAEGDETFQVQLAGASGNIQIATDGGGTATVTIRDDDAAASPSPSPTRSASPSPSPSGSPTPEPIPLITPDRPSPSPSASPSAAPTASPSPSASATASPAPTPPDMSSTEPDSPATSSEDGPVVIATAPSPDVVVDVAAEPVDDDGSFPWLLLVVLLAGMVGAAVMVVRRK